MRRRLVDLLLLLVIAGMVLGGIEIGSRLREHHQLVEAILDTLKQAQQPRPQVPQQPPP